MSAGNRYLVFYAGLLYEDYPAPPLPERIWKPCWPRDLPDGAYILNPDNEWFRSDLTPVLLEEVPKELRALVLLLT